jgi:hypothetical protein
MLTQTPTLFSSRGQSLTTTIVAAALMAHRSTFHPSLRLPLKPLPDRAGQWLERVQVRLEPLYGLLAEAGLFFNG